MLNERFGGGSLEKWQFGAEFSRGGKETPVGTEGAAAKRYKQPSGQEAQ